MKNVEKEKIKRISEKEKNYIKELKNEEEENQINKKEIQKMYED